MKKIVVLLVALIILSTCLASCGNSKAIQNKLCASTWEFDWDGIQVETYKFNSDGTYKLTIESTLVGYVEQTGSYTISDEKEKIELVRDGDSYKSELSYTYSNNTLTVTCRNKTVSK